MEPKEDNGAAREFGRGYLYVGVGFQFVGAILLFLYLGWKADGWLGIKPVLTILGAFLGAALGFYAILREVQQDVERRKSRGKTD
ncbi:MAG: AtpZ/AtpI family protein [Gemmatimonadales bacterium]